VEQIAGITSMKESGMMTRIEKMLILKTFKIFAKTLDDVLVQIASRVEEEEVPAGETIIQKGDLGDCLYIVVAGRLRVQDGDRTISEFRERQEFCLQALLDREPRSASVITLEDTLLLRLDQVFSVI
jgi:CRP/FNR family transcriptional regulator, cyclic AMP receptor protein